MIDPHSATSTQEQASLHDLLADAPTNWGRWGPEDELGALNFLTPQHAAEAAALVTSGKSFTLQIKICNPEGDPMFPGRAESQRYNVRDKGSYLAGKVKPYAGGLEFADDFFAGFLQCSTQYDALGHAWYGDHIWNGYDAKTTIGALSRASVLPIAERGVVGRGVLLDIARHRGKESLDRGETISHEDLLTCAAAQGVEIRPHDVLMVHTGWLNRYYATADKTGYYDDYLEPGLTYSAELVEWFHQMEIPNLVTDTLANEVTVDPVSGITLPLHAALMRNLGVAFTEVAWLHDLAADSAADRQFDAMYVGAPLKVVGATGSPVNPMVVK